MTFSRETFWHVTGGNAQVLIIKWTMSVFLSAASVSQSGYCACWLTVKWTRLTGSNHYLKKTLFPHNVNSKSLLCKCSILFSFEEYIHFLDSFPFSLSACCHFKYVTLLKSVSETLFNFCSRCLAISAKSSWMWNWIISFGFIHIDFENVKCFFFLNLKFSTLSVS